MRNSSQALKIDQNAEEALFLLWKEIHWAERKILNRKMVVYAKMQVCGDSGFACRTWVTLTGSEVLIMSRLAHLRSFFDVL